jgi:hypothetical protein
MTHPQQSLAWRRRFPSHALASFGWYVLAAGIGVGVVWLLFGSEQRVLDTGESNPLAVILPVTVAVVALGAVPFVLRVLRGPVVAADHYALRVRPTWVRTLVLPWARIAAVVAHRVDEEPYLLVRCRDSLDRLGDRPGWVDRTVLRQVQRAADIEWLGRFDLAVRMGDFAGTPRVQLMGLAAFAPDHVFITGDVDEPA